MSKAEETTEERSRRSTSCPRRYIKDTSDERCQDLHMVRCPFCDKKMRTEQEPEFRSHLRMECEEAPRDVNRDVPDWRDELEEFAPEDSDDSEDGSRSDSDRPDDAPGEVLPV